MTRRRSRRRRSLLVFVFVAALTALALVACRSPNAPAAPAAPVPGAAPDAAAPRWVQARVQLVEEIVSAKEPMNVFAIGGAILVVRRDGGRFRIARLENGKLVDEDGWSRGLPPPRMSNGEPAFVCNRIEAIFGRFPDRLWLIENSGGSMSCRSTFGEYAVWHRRNGTWSKDAAHSPAPGKPAEGVLATWPLGPGVLGMGVSNLVGDTLTAPVDAAWTLHADPWATRVHLRREGASILSVCASASGSVAVLSLNGSRFSLETVEPDGTRSTVDVPPPHAPEHPCAANERAVLVVQPPRDSTREETWLSFDRTTRAWAPTVVPWSYRTWRIDSSGSRIVAWTADAKSRTHVFVVRLEDVLRGNHDASAWTEIVGLPESDDALEVVSWPAEDEALVLVDKTKLVRLRLPQR